MKHRLRVKALEKLARPARRRILFAIKKDGEYFEHGRELTPEEVESTDLIYVKDGTLLDLV